MRVHRLPFQGQRDHAFDRLPRPVGDIRIDQHFVLHRLERMQNLRQRDPLHVRAQIAGPHEIHVRVLERNIVRHRAFGDEDDVLRLMFLHEIRHAAGRAGEIRLGENVGRALRVGEDDDAGVSLAHFADILGGEALMHFARARPCNDLDVGHRRDVLRKILVGNEDDGV